MFYYIPQDYGERYIVPFQDVEGNDWKVSIAQPNYSGNIVTLTGGAFPVEWEGRGDESQDEVVLGSTGKLRLICRNATEHDTVFAKGALLPSCINDCRVQVCRMVDDLWQIYWQGFIQPQTFSQDWDSTPYEIELPIVSVVAALEYFPMPSPFPAGTGSNCYDYFAEQTTIGGLLRAIFCWTGCEIRRIITNKPNYQDFNGNLVYQGELPMHWTEGILSHSYFYDTESGILRPKTFKDVIETLCYPFGKVSEYNLDVAFLLRWKNDANNDSRLYSISLWKNYDGAEYLTTTRFGEYSPISKLNLSAINTAGTDNTHSIIQPPLSVKFTSSDSSDTEIFSLSESFIKSSYPIAETLANTLHVRKDFNAKNRFVFPINKGDVDLGFAFDWEFSNTQSEQLSDYSFCRVIEVTANSSGSEHTFSSSTVIPFGFCFNVYSESSAQSYTASVAFTIPTGVRTIPNTNNIKLTIKPYIISAEDPSMGGYVAFTPSTELKVFIQDISNGNKYLTQSENDLVWVSSKAPAPIHNSNNEFFLHFCEERTASDKTLHNLRISLECTTNDLAAGSNYTYGHMYCDLKLEYVDEDRMFQINGNWTYSSDAVLGPLAKGIKNRAEISVSDGGDTELDIEMKTRAGIRYITTGKTALMPANSFNDNKGYIDRESRVQIEINAAQYKIYNIGGEFDLVNRYAVVIDGNKVFVPVAVGMNPRMNTLKLTLVSTNVTS